MQPHPNFKILAQSGEFEKEDVFYTTLDSWLDTRLGTLGKINPALATKALNGKYRERFIDEFEGISREEFKAAYDARDIDTLKMSLVTNVSFLMRRIIKDSLAIAVQQKKISKLNIDVNVHPYDIDNGELPEMLLQCIRAHVYENANVRIISAPPEAITPEFVRNNYDMMVMYDWMQWIELHKAVFEKRGIPGVTLIAPQLFVDRPPTQEEQRQFGQGSDGDVFRVTEKMFAPLIRLNLMPASLFSLIDDVKKSNAEYVVKRTMLTPEDIEAAILQVRPDAKIEGAAQAAPNIVVPADDNEEGYVLL